MGKVKMRHSNKTILFIVLIFSIVVGCFAKDPNWMGKTWLSGNNMYFAGISGEEATLKDAKEQAYIDALQKVGQYIGMSVNAKTVQTLTSDDSSIESLANILLKDVYLSQISIKEFKYTKTNNRYVGNVLLECNVSMIEKEKQRRIEEENKRRQLLERRKALGIFIVQTQSNSIKPIIADIKSILQSEGYEISPHQKGNPIILNLIDENFSQSSQEIYSYNFNVEIIFNNNINTLSAKGFGNSQDNAKRYAYKKWIEAFRNRDW
jgi:hypothetical protein